jgi:regulation of enolase protein 1 (concanavalin A-like superfamily)
MHKVVRFFRRSSFIPIGIGILAVILYVLNQMMLAIWLAHIFTVIYFTPIAYELTASFNLTFCRNSVLIYDKPNDFKKTVKLDSFWRKLFYGYDNENNMLWLILLYQCILLAYTCVFIFLNIIFIIALITTHVNSAIWIKLWLFEIVAQCVIFAVVIASSYLKDIYFWSKERKKTHFKISRTNMIKRDIKMIQNKKIIKQKNEIVTFLKQYSLHVDRHKFYIANATDFDKMEESLTQVFPKLYITASKNQKGHRILQIYDKKKEYLLIQIRAYDK